MIRHNNFWIGKDENRRVWFLKDLATPTQNSLFHG